MDTQFELDIHRFTFQTSAQLKDTTDPDKVLRHYLRATLELMEGARGHVVRLRPGDEAAQIVFAQPADSVCDLPLVTALLRGERVPIPPGTLCARITRRGRSWGMIVLERGGRFPEGYPRALTHVAREVSERIGRLDQGRLDEVRARIDNMILRELPPKDLYYQILDGLHQLTRYDHSAALWIWPSPEAPLELVAEQIAWRKMKSARIGRTLELPASLRRMLRESVVYGFDTTPAGWAEWTSHGAAELAALLNGSDEPSERPSERAMLCASLGDRHGPLGLLKLSACAPETFGAYELAIVERFTTLASLAITRARTVEALQARMLKIERQNALAQLARGVAHDVNNALGEVIPLVQQMRSELREGSLDPKVLEEDLQRVEHSLQVTRGIFSRMTRFARGAQRTGGESELRPAFQAVQEVLEEGLLRSGIRLREELPAVLPSIQCGPSDLERLLLNLMTNARDAMPGGGTLQVQARVAGDHIVLVVQDDGIGMSPEILKQTEGPFFTTKEHGTGLGLSTCRSIAAEAGGDLRLESRPGEGTRVTVRLAAVRPAEG